MDFFYPRKLPEEALVKTLIRSALAILFVSVGLAWAAYPVSVVDDLGRNVTLTAEPLRIVTMMPSHTETVCALGACDRLVGVDRFSNYPPEIDALPRLGSAFTPNLEAIVALEPDLVLVDESSDLAAQLEQIGLTVYAGTAQTFEEVFEKFLTIGRLIGKAREAELLAERVRSEIDEVVARVAGERHPRVYYEIDATPFSVGPNSFIGALIAKAGGENIVAPDMGDFPQLDPEFIVAADPEIIVLGNAPYGESVATVSARPGWAGITAVIEGRIIELTEEQVDAISRPGPRIAEAIRLFAAIFHPELFD